MEKQNEREKKKNVDGKGKRRWTVERLEDR